MDESPQSYQAPSSGALFVAHPLSRLVSDTKRELSPRLCVVSDTVVMLLERLGTLLGLPVLVVLPTYVMTRLHLQETRVSDTKRGLSPGLCLVSDTVLAARVRR